MSKRSLFAIIVIVSSFGTAVSYCQAQGEETSANRKVVNKVTPEYPHLARQMNLQGSVKLEVSVTGNGTVKSVEVKGGSPILVQSAQSAVRMWRWEKADHETIETIEFKFHP